MTSSSQFIQTHSVVGSSLHQSSSRFGNVMQESAQCAVQLTSCTSITYFHSRKVEHPLLRQMFSCFARDTTSQRATTFNDAGPLHRADVRPTTWQEFDFLAAAGGIQALTH